MAMDNNKYKDPEANATRDKIIHTLIVYPILSPTMLQAGIGPYRKPAHWRPILEDLINEGIIIRDLVEHKTPTDRHNTYTILRLSDEAREEYNEHESAVA